MMKDKITILDELTMDSGGQTRRCPPVFDKEPILIEGFFSAVCRERGKIVPGSRREGKNIWTLAGREYVCRVMSYAAYGVPPAPDVPARNDRIRYIGFGIGSTPEVSSVSRLVQPVAFNTSNEFLAEVSIPSYPFQTSATSFGTAVRYTREFAENELSISGTIILTEAGLFTDGSPTSGFAPGTRDIKLDAAGSQAPVGYKSFDPLKKTTNFVLQIAWEVRI